MRSTASCRPCPTGTFQLYLDGANFLKRHIRNSSLPRELTRTELRNYGRARPPCTARRALPCASCAGQVASRKVGLQCASAARWARNFCLPSIASARGMRSRFASMPGSVRTAAKKRPQNAARKKCVGTLYAPDFKMFDNTGQCRCCYLFLKGDVMLSSCNEYCPYRFYAPPSSAMPFRPAPSSQS